MHIGFNQIYLTGNELKYIQKALAGGKISGNGPFTKNCQVWLEQHLKCQKTLLVQSCTASLEMSALLLDIKPGDEIIMPSFTFVSTANAFVLRGAVPVFVDIRPDTLNLDEKKIEAAITPQTKAIVPVHYGGISCEMDTILAIAQKHHLWVVEDAAQGLGASYKNRPLGTLGHLGALSFHETKNIIAGEGGALLVNETQFMARAEILWEKGTNRGPFSRGEVDKYTWLDKGSSFLPSELMAAFLYAQLESADEILKKRLEIWTAYHAGFKALEVREKVHRPCTPKECVGNGHLFYLLLPNEKTRNTLLACLNKEGINAIFHYIPLHESPAGQKYGRTEGKLEMTETLSRRLIRFPFWVGIQPHIDFIIEKTTKIIDSLPN